MPRFEVRFHFAGQNRDGDAKIVAVEFEDENRGAILNQVAILLGRTVFTVLPTSASSVMIPSAQVQFVEVNDFPTPNR